MKLKAWIVVFGIFVLLDLALVADARTIDRKHLADSIDQFVQAYNTVGIQQKINGVILIARADEILFEGAYGVAHEDTHLATDSIFNIGSIGKYYTATALQLLEEKGVLSLSDPIGNYLDHPDGDRITIVQLLNHISGLKRDDYDGSTRMHQYIPLQEMVTQICRAPLDYEPGTKFQYSNWGFILAARIVEIVSGMPFDQYVSSQLLAPLNSRNTRVDMGTDPALLADLVSGHRHNKNGLYTTEPYNASWFVGAGNIYTNARELWEFYRLWVATRIAEAITQEVDLGLPEIMGYRYVAHGGHNTGYQSYIYHFPHDDDLVIILLTNVDGQDIEDMTAALIAIVFDRHYRIPRPKTKYLVEPTILDDYEGLYRQEDGTVVRIARMRDHLWIQPSLAGNTLMAESDRVFYPQNNPVYELEFVLKEDGEIDGFILRKSVEETYAKKLQ